MKALVTLKTGHLRVNTNNTGTNHIYYFTHGRPVIAALLCRVLVL